MNASKVPVTGCLVTDVQTGETLGWVKNIVFDAHGEPITELLVDPSARPRSADEGGERLLGRPLFDAAQRYLGEIVDLVIGTQSGRVHGVMIERTPGQQDYVPTYQGLRWEGDHWVLLAEPSTLRHMMLPETPAPAIRQEPGEDWMVGQIATVRLQDRRGHVIVEPGQTITASIVEQASRAGVLHRLEGRFASERT
ncbi:MAG TPA: PRC-barrel domain-containing protein [Oscillatoriaceae cyanobacterium]